MLFQKHRYSLVPESSKTESQFSDGTSSRCSQSTSPVAASTLLLAALCFVAGITGYFAAQFGAHLLSDNPTLGYLPLDTVSQTFRYNRSFSDRPSNDTNAAWRSIFPIKGGFFINPTVAPARSTFSVYHQLHCLDGLRYGYYLNHEAAVQGKKMVDGHLPFDLQSRHMRHCIDLLRQALMCNADTTFEVVDEKVNGVHGFRTEHQCKDWQQLLDWTNKQQKREHSARIE